MRTKHIVDNRRGWQLELHHFLDEETFDPEKRPVVLFPGYGMNSFILGFHPRGKSLVEYIVDGGYEVWTANLRGQGNARRTHGSKRITFSNIAGVDIPVVFDYVHEKTKTQSEFVTAVGCSLGATFLYAYLGIHESTPVRAMISMGGPLRWKKAHPLVKIIFGSRRVAARVPLTGTRKIAEVLLPIVSKVPPVLSMYMNANRIDLTNVGTLTQTVDDPIPSLNVEIAQWLKTKDLEVDGFNITQEMAHIDFPLLQICANRDGIVPVETALSAADAFGSTDVTSLIAGDDKNWFAHADLFINDESEQRVFRPMRNWLDRV